MELKVKEKNGYTFIDEGKGANLVLLHGLFGALSNWETVVSRFKEEYRVIIPMLPIYTMSPRKASMDKLNEFLEGFVEMMGIDDMNIVGNSLGGHIGLIYTLKNQSKVKTLTLTGSSGLFEDSMGGSYPRRGSYDYIKERVSYTFYEPEVATKELIDEVFETTSNISKCLSIVAIAKSAQRHNMADDIANIKVPTLLVWGLNDTITPPVVGYEFDRLLPNSTLKFIDKCCHAPMMEHSETFNNYLDEFLLNNK